MNWRKQVEDFKSSLKPIISTISADTMRMGFFGEIGSGKSTTACICAIPFTPTGTIGLIDGEHHRSGWAVDVVADMAVKKYGGKKSDWVARFKVVHVEPPFHPLRIVAAAEMLVEQGAKTIIYDILTQAWDSAGGYLDLKEEKIDAATGGDDSKRQKHAQSAAAQVKPWTHQKLVHCVETLPGNAILVFQAKKKWNAAQNKVSEFETPIQESGITRTAIAVGRVNSKIVNNEPVCGFCSFSGQPGATKHTHPALLKLLPNDAQFTFEHAEALVAWCKNGSDPRKALLSELWALSKNIRGSVKDWSGFEQWAIEKAILGDTEEIKSMTLERLQGLMGDFKKI